MKPRIAVLPGDGIGPEVIDAALEVIAPHVSLTHIGAGADRFLATGQTLTSEDIATIGSCDALLFGAVGDPRVPDGVLERGILLRLRQELDLYVNVRPVPELDLVIVRENTEGLYAGVGSSDDDSAMEISVNSRTAVQRCIHYALS
ncbi:MAG: isocitrate/isopropylmalate family dehydrogenase, partial [Actinomycetota bacterium]